MSLAFYGLVICSFVMGIGLKVTYTFWGVARNFHLSHLVYVCEFGWFVLTGSKIAVFGVSLNFLNLLIVIAAKLLDRCFIVNECIIHYEHLSKLFWYILHIIVVFFLLCQFNSIRYVLCVHWIVRTSYIAWIGYNCR